MAFSRHEQLFSNMDLLKFLVDTIVDEKPPFEVLPETAEPRRVKMSLLAAACWRMAARDGGLGFISEAGERSSTASLESIDALEIGVTVDSLNKLPEADSLHGVLMVRFFAYTVLAVSIFGGALVLTAFKASVATATVTILKMGIDR